MTCKALPMESKFRTTLVFVPQAIPAMLPKLNPGQHRMFERHVERAVETLREADRLLKGAVTDIVERCIAFMTAEAAQVEHEKGATVEYPFTDLPPRLVPYLDHPFAQGLAFNLHCVQRNLSHTQAAKDWVGGPAAVAARNLLFLPPLFGELWDAGLIDKTRLIAISNRNLKMEGYEDLAHLIKTRRKEDVDGRLIKMPAQYLRVGRRGPQEAMLAAEDNGWLKRFERVELPQDLVLEAGVDDEPEVKVETPAGAALVALRAGLGGAKIADEVIVALGHSPNPAAMVERFLSAHRQSGDPDVETLTKTLFFAHAGPMQKLVADDKLLLRHCRPVKTQKRGQLFYKILEVLEESILERAHLANLEERGITEQEGVEVVRRVIAELNKDPNRFLQIPEEWLGEITRRHLYFGGRTRKEGAAYKWFRKIGNRFYLGGHKTGEEISERAARRAAKLGATGVAGAADMDDVDDYVVENTGDDVEAEEFLDADDFHNS